MEERLDVMELRKECFDKIKSLLCNLKNNGNRWTCLNPTRQDNHNGNFVIFSKDYGYYDFATKEKGDTIDLYCHLFKVSKSEFFRAKRAEKFGGQIRSGPIQRLPEPIKNSDASEEDKSFQIGEIPVPPFVPQKSDIEHPKLGIPDQIYTYKNKCSHVIGFLARFERTDPKKICLPFTYDFWKGKWEFSAEGFEGQKPFYQMDLLNQKHKKWLIVEGEKTAEAAKVLLKEGHLDHIIPNARLDTNVLTWFGGSTAVKKADWKTFWECHPTEIYLSPDMDEPGLEAMKYIQTLFPYAHLLTSSSDIKGYDLADYLEEIQTS